MWIIKALLLRTRDATRPKGKHFYLNAKSMKKIERHSFSFSFCIRFEAKRFFFFFFFFGPNICVQSADGDKKREKMRPTVFNCSNLILHFTECVRQQLSIVATTSQLVCIDFLFFLLIWWYREPKKKIDAFIWALNRLFCFFVENLLWSHKLCWKWPKLCGTGGPKWLVHYYYYLWWNYFAADPTHADELWQHDNNNNTKQRKGMSNML